MKRNRSAGFTLIELMIALVILAVLAAIAYPSYMGHLTRTRRAECMGEMLNFANAMERYFTQNGTYVGAAAGTVFPNECPLDGDPKVYDLTIQASAATTYTLRATPKNAQAGDGIIEVTQTGRRGWDRNNDGDTADAGEDTWDK